MKYLKIPDQSKGTNINFVLTICLTWIIAFRLLPLDSLVLVVMQTGFVILVLLLPVERLFSRPPGWFFSFKTFITPGQDTPSLTRGITYAILTLSILSHACKSSQIHPIYPCSGGSEYV